ncbi:MAG: peptidase inhibitor I78, partial [Sphingomonadaceae bacterium]|nr:peptidase inhibitor I78 [Sphingomonadaceae bacterium]
AGGPCGAGPAQGLIGRAVDSAVGAEAMRLSGAQTLRWIGPGQAVTMDYRPDRLNVEYDEGRRVTAIRCG